MLSVGASHPPIPPPVPFVLLVLMGAGAGAGTDRNPRHTTRAMQDQQRWAAVRASPIPHTMGVEMQAAKRTYDPAAYKG